MKLDEKYFDCKLIDLLNCFSFRKHLNPEPNDGYKPELDILQQIARDAAEGQRINCSAACALRMKGRVDANCKCGEIYCTAKLEIPHA